MENWERIVSIALPEIVQGNISLKNLNTWRVGGEAELFCRPLNLDQLKEVYMWAHHKNIPVTALGGGSNVLISDKGVKGLVISTRNFDKVLEAYEKDNKFFVKTEAGAKKAEVLKLFLKKNLAPALFLAGLPGDVAGGVVMNAGVSEKITPREFVEVVHEFEVLKVTEQGTEINNYKNEDVHWEYRHSKGWQPGLITTVTLSWPLTPDAEIKSKVREANHIRLQKQPLKQPSCGSTFRNPEGDAAGRLIEQAGLKGFQIGGAQVSEKHANFIVTKDGAKAQDVSDIMDHVVKRVQEKFNVNLQSEVIKLGEWS